MVLAHLNDGTIKRENYPQCLLDYAYFFPFTPSIVLQWFNESTLVDDTFLFSVCAPEALRKDR